MRHPEDFAEYDRMRLRTLKRIKLVRCYLGQLQLVVEAMPPAASAGYLDLDNLECLDGQTADAEEALCSTNADWDALGLEFSRLGIR